MAKEALDGVVSRARGPRRDVLRDIDNAVRAVSQPLEEAKVEVATGNGEASELGKDCVHLHHGGRRYGGWEWKSER